MNEVKNFINGEYRASSGGKSFDNVNPCTGALNGSVHEATREDVDAAVQAARAALSGPWGRMSDAERGEILHRVADGIDARFDEFLAAECADTGKPYGIASHIEVWIRICQGLEGVMIGGGGGVEGGIRRGRRGSGVMSIFF